MAKMMGGYHEKRLMRIMATPRRGLLLSRCKLVQSHSWLQHNLQGRVHACIAPAAAQDDDFKPLWLCILLDTYADLM
jgi:hypothetical protein